MSISASAPGKVLICGGYLVVESPNVGLSIGVNARFKTELKEAKLAPEAGDLIVKVASPQFGADFTFVVTHDGASVTVKQTEGRETPFLYCAVLVTTSFLLGVSGLPSGEVSLVLLADNDFYSQRNFLEGQGKKVSAETLRGVPPHNPLVGDVSKTGLGSSAALTTSLVACVATALARASGNAAAQEVVKATETLHRLAQAAHSIAQGKIGSGFDVFTAVYGTSVYVRFQPSCVDTLMSGSVPTTLAAKTVTDCVDLGKAWVPERPVHVAGLPPGVKLLLADIHQGGSSTPGMVSKIMAWRKSVASEAGNLWDRLGAANQAYLATMVSLHAAAAAEATRPQYDATVAKLAGVPAAQWEAAADDSNAALFLGMRDGASQTRGMLREVGEAAGVEVEPPTLTPLLDATRALPGVVAAGCPGAGGYDAVFALVLGDDVASAVEKFWEGYGGLEVCPLLVREDAQGLVVNVA